MHSVAHTNSPRHLRTLLYVFAFVLLVSTALLTVWTNSNAAGSSANIPTGNTIPPGGTIPPPVDPASGEGQVNILHVAPIAGDLIDTGVQICDTGGSNVTDYLYYQQQTGYFSLPIGSYDWFIGAAGGNCQTLVHDIPAFNVGSGARLLLIIFGDQDNQPLDTMLFVEHAGQFIYNLPYIIQD